MSVYPLSISQTAKLAGITAIQLMTGRIPDFYIPYIRELSYFTECLRQDLPPSPSAEDALKDIEIITLAYKNKTRLD